MSTEVTPRSRRQAVAARAVCAALALLTHFSTPARAALPARPRLVVVVSIDQLGRDLIDRYVALFPPGGFRRLLEAGADYPNCEHGHYVTLTGPGHAVMLTGAYPIRTGIVANRWYSRRAGKMVNCVEDARFPMLEPGGTAFEKGFSPLNMRASTVGDVLRANTASRAKVIGLALKDRVAILLAGWRPSGAYWLDDGTCHFDTSSYYAPALPAWVAEFNAAGFCTGYVGKTWNKLRPDLDYASVADVDDAPYEKDAFGLGRVFPHPVKTSQPANARYGAVVTSPFGNELLLNLAKSAIAAEQLGRDDVPDLLALGFSSNDYVGHAYGPHSQEVLDMTLRTDRVLADLMDHLDRVVGKDRWTLALTSDHGVAPVPEYLEKNGLLPARPDHHRWRTEQARQEVEQTLIRTYFGGDLSPANFPGFFTAWDDATSPFVWINRSALEQLPDPPSSEEFLSTVRGAIESRDGVARVYVSSERDRLGSSDDLVERRVARSWDRENGGDLVVQLEPYWFPGFGAATTHGSPYSYDTHVPMLLYGVGVRAGRFPRPVAVVDLASTVANLLGIQPPPYDQGEPLREALGGGPGS